MWDPDDIDYPEHVYVDLTNRCNLRCVTCLHDDPAYHRAARLDMSDRVIDRLRTSVFPRARAVTLSGSGEAVLHPRFDELLAESGRHGFLPMLTTNATLLDDRRRQMLVDCGAYVWVSFDAASPELFEQIRVGAKQHKVLGNVAEMIRYSHSHANDRFCVCFVVTLQRRNIRELADIVRLAARMGVEQVFAHHVTTDMIPHKDISLDHEPALSDAMVEEAFEAASEHGIFLEAPEPFSDDVSCVERLDQLRFTFPPNRMTRYHTPSYGPGRRFTCAVPWRDIYFKVDGRARFCCLHHEELDIGSLEESEFEEIWFGPRYHELRSTVNSRRPPRYCHPSACQVRSPFWHGGCVPETEDGLVFTSRYPNLLRYAMRADARQVDSNRSLVVLTTRLTNTGDTTWLESASVDGGERHGRVALGYQLCAEDGQCLYPDYLRMPLDRDVAPGESVDITHVESADKILGRRFKVDLIDEGICWFEDTGQSPGRLDLVDRSSAAAVGVVDGDRVPAFTSRAPNRMWYEMQAHLRTVDFTNHLLVVDLEIENTGDTVWLESASFEGAERHGRVAIGLKLCTADGRCLERDYWRVTLDREVAPGEFLNLELNVELADRARGKRFKIDLVDEGICWFEDTGQTPCWIDVGD